MAELNQEKRVMPQDQALLGTTISEYRFFIHGVVSGYYKRIHV